MIGIDTNILVRYLVQDDAVQSARATDLVEKRLSPEHPGFISTVVMVETAWVLARSYRRDSQAIAAAIERLLRADVFVVDSEQEVFTAMCVAREGRGSFSDALIAELAIAAGCAYTLTFDQKAARLSGFLPA